MAAKKNSSGMVGGGLLFLGSLVYLYVLFTWYSSGAAAGPWLAMAQFFAPFVAAAAIVSAITLFFMGIGQAAGKSSNDEMMTKVLWKFVMIAGISTIIATAGTSWFYVAIVGFLLTYIGAMAASM
jgi:hypothetical protein